MQRVLRGMRCWLYPVCGIGSFFACGLYYVMPQPKDPDSLYVPLFEALDAVGFGEHGNPHHFNTSTLFWSLTRLFGSYERILSVLDVSRDQRPYLDADIESFIIRFRIVLNDVAYVLWQLLPPNTRGLKAPKGGTHPRNRELSIFTLAEHLLGSPQEYPELAEVFVEAEPWMRRLKDQRDNVVHYKSKVLIFESVPLSFALVNAAGTERTEPAPEGGQRLVMEPVGQFVNSQLLALHVFMHDRLATAVAAQARRLDLKSVQVGWAHRMSSIGIRRFRKVNALH